MIEVRVLEDRVEEVLDELLDGFRLTRIPLGEDIGVDDTVPGELHRRGVRQVHDVVVPAFLHVVAFARLALDDADDAVFLTVYTQFFSDSGLRAAEQFLSRVESDHADFLTARDVCILDETAGLQRFAENIEIILTDAGHGRAVHVVAAVLDGR